MIKRTYDAMLLDEIVNKLVRDPDNRPDPIDWISDPDNIILVNDMGDVAVFEYAFEGKKIYSGHYYFRSRGRAAITAGKEFLREVLPRFKTLIGLVPVEHKAARWMSRQLGFESFGFDTIKGNEYEMFFIGWPLNE